MTPQTLMNDLHNEICDPLDVILFVVGKVSFIRFEPGKRLIFLSTDEAHRATGDYAYNQVIRFLMAKNPHFRVLALTATPGNNPEAVQVLIDGLHISRIEIRDEDSLDLKQYIHKKVGRFGAVESLTSNIARSSKNTLSNQLKTLRRLKSCCAKR